MPAGSSTTATAADLRRRLELRNRTCESFLNGEAPRLATLSRQMAERFQRGGRLLALGNGCHMTDAQHVAVEFVHPVIVGKQALPALDVSAFGGSLEAILRPADMVMGFGPPAGDPHVDSILAAAGRAGALTVALPGSHGDYVCEAPSADPFVHQEVIEILYHTLWETVHVFLERKPLGFDAGESAFLYPFLGEGGGDLEQLEKEVAASIRMKVEDDSALRLRVADDESSAILQAALAIGERLAQGGKILAFGNGGSATDATDFGFDCVTPPKPLRPVPAVSLSLEPAHITAIANDVGTEVIFLRQLIAHAEPQDVAFGISTSGGSKNVIAAFAEARRRGLLTVALLGNDGGEIVRRGLADVSIVVRSDYIPRIQEVQASVYHLLRELWEEPGHGAL